MEEKFSTLEEIMKQMIEFQTNPASSEARTSTTRKCSEGNPNYGARRDDRDVKILGEGEGEGIPPLEPLAKRGMGGGYGARRDWEEETRRVDFEGGYVHFRRRGKREQWREQPTRGMGGI